MSKLERAFVRWWMAKHGSAVARAFEQGSRRELARLSKLLGREYAKRVQGGALG